MKANIYIRVYCYPTENLDKVKQLFSILEIENYLIEEIKEAFGLSMYILSSFLNREKYVIKFFKKLFELSEDPERIYNYLEETFDEKEKACYLRIDKQVLFKDKKVKPVSHGDVIHLKIKLIEPRDLNKFIEELKSIETQQQ